MKPLSERMREVGVGLLISEWASEVEAMEKELAALRANPVVSEGSIAKIHDDGFWTHKDGKDPLDRFSGNGRSMDVYSITQLQSAYQRGAAEAHAEYEQVYRASRTELGRVKDFDDNIYANDWFGKTIPLYRRKEKDHD